MQRHAHEADLAWALAPAATPQLDTVDRIEVSVAIGAGETFEAIRRLLKLVAVKHIPVKPDLVLGCIAWLHGYVGHEDEGTLRGHIEDFMITYPTQVPATVQVYQLPTTPRRRQLAALSNR
jgi:hypothetical protein